MEKKSEVDEFLNGTFKSKIKVPVIVPKYSKPKKSKIELLGKEVVAHLIELAKSTDLSYSAMARRITEKYGGDITIENVKYFFRANANALIKLAEEQKSLSKIRADLFLDYNGALVKDIKVLDKEVEKLLEDEMLESDKRAKAISDLLDKKGRLLLRHARLSGTLKSQDSKVQVNIFKQVNIEKSDIIKRLKKVEFKSKIIDVPNENQKADN